MRLSTEWVPAQLEDLITFSRMNSLPGLRRKLEEALETFSEDERAFALRNPSK
jgi:hypothetical protein